MVLMVMVSLSLPNPAQASALSEGEYYTLTIMHTNDIHGHVDQLPQYATIIDQVRSEADNVLVLDAGDIFLRGEFEQLQGKMEMSILNAIGYDAWVYGNNDFRIGPSGGTIKQGNEQIEQLAKQADFPTLCANVFSKDSGSYLEQAEPYIIKELSEVNVGIIGVTSLKPQDRGWKEVSDKTFVNGQTAVQELIPELEDKTDINLVLSHAGLMVDIGISNVEGVSAVIGGDDHFTIKSPIYTNYKGMKNTPIVQAGGEDEHYLGRLDLIFQEKNDELVLVDHQGSLYELEDVEKTSVIEEIIQLYRQMQKAA